jgi:hypothetical protein
LALLEAWTTQEAFGLLFVNSANNQTKPCLKFQTVQNKLEFFEIKKRCFVIIRGGGAGDNCGFGFWLIFFGGVY